MIIMSYRDGHIMRVCVRGFIRMYIQPIVILIFVIFMYDFMICTLYVCVRVCLAKVISEHRLINVVCHPGIEPGTLRFQDNHETHYATEATFYD